MLITIYLLTPRTLHMHCEIQKMQQSKMIQNIPESMTQNSLATLFAAGQHLHPTFQLPFIPPSHCRPLHTIPRYLHYFQLLLKPSYYSIISLPDSYLLTPTFSPTPITCSHNRCIPHTFIQQPMPGAKVTSIPYSNPLQSQSKYASHFHLTTDAEVVRSLQSPELLANNSNLAKPR